MMLDILSKFEPISLDEMSGIKLMNRTDTKFVTNRHLLLKLLELANKEYFVQEIGDSRLAEYYTVYFDTNDCAMFTAHQNGFANRQKIRIRSYVDSNLNFLEVKTKNNHKRTSKKRVTMQGFDPRHPDHDITFDSHDDTFKGYDEFIRKHLRYNPETLKEQLENHFQRITLVNKKKTERLTIDTSLSFHNIVTGKDRTLDDIVIIELKRDGLQPSPILKLLNQLRIKPMGFSKYCIGSAFTNGNLKQNRFKERLRTIEKIKG